MDQAAIERFRVILTAEAKRLEAELSSLAAPDARMADDWDAKFPTAPASAPSSHSSQEEQADLVEEYESAVAQEQTLELRLREVKRALERIASNTFGLCRACGEPIPEERLAANPAAEYDMAHQPKG